MTETASHPLIVATNFQVASMHVVVCHLQVALGMALWVGTDQEWCLHLGKEHRLVSYEISFQANSLDEVALLDLPLFNSIVRVFLSY